MVLRTVRRMKTNSNLFFPSRTKLIKPYYNLSRDGNLMVSCFLEGQKVAPNTAGYFSNPHQRVPKSIYFSRFAGRWQADAQCFNRMARLSINIPPHPPPNDGRHDRSKTDL